MKPPIPIAKPCPRQWDDMDGDHQRRFCQHCELHVHDLSAMSPRQLRQFVAQPGPRPCITYQQRPDGTLVTAPAPWTRPFRRALAALLALVLPVALTSCSTPQRTVGVPPPPLQK